jgi:thiol-disulfide isomerase/thioredoxin
MKICRFGLIAVLIYLSSSVIGGKFLDATAGSIGKIEESELDAMIGNGHAHLVMVFMAAWCAPCIEELPALNKLNSKYADQGLEIIGISIDLDGPDALQPIIDQQKVNFPVYWYGEKAVEKFSIFAIPMLIFVKEGGIVERIHGRRPESFLNAKFMNFLNN